MSEPDLRKRLVLIQNFRDFADFLTIHPEAPVPEFGIYLNVFAKDADHFRAIVKVLGRGEMTPDSSDKWITMRWRFGHICYDVNIATGELQERVVIEVSE